MADNTTLNAGVGGDLIATDDIAGVKYQRVKLTTGADGTADDVSSTHPVPVNDAGGSLTVDGTVAVSNSTFPVTDNSGSLTVDAPAATPVFVRLSTGSAAIDTIPVSLASVPSHAVTNAGTFAVQGTAAGTVAHDGVGTGVNPVLLGGYASAAAPTDVSTDGDAVRAWLLKSGAQVTALSAAGALIGATSNALDVNIKSGGSSGGTATADAGTGTRGTTSATPIMGLVETSAPTLTTGHLGMPSMTTGGAIRVDVSSGSVPGIADDSAFTPASSVLLPVGYTADETATDSVDEGDLGAARMTLDRKQIVTEYVHSAAGGTSQYSAISASGVLSAAVKASPGKVFAISGFNSNAAARYVRLYNQTGAPASTDTPVWRGMLPAGGGFSHTFKGMQFSTGIAIRASTGAADNDTGALTASEQLFNVEYV